MATYQSPHRSWPKKFADAFAGIAAGVRNESSFWVHVPATIAVAIAAVALRVTYVEACLLALCVTAVLGAELLNSALERMARATTNDYSEDVRVALNVSSGAVLVIALGAAVVGGIIFIPYLLAFVRSA
jgi:diacylglycerol kinase (ATP)